MSTQQQSNASRANGAAGKGPVTVPGKLNSSANAATTGLSSEKTFLRNTGDDIDRVAAITTQYLDAIKPRNIVELHYTHRLINYHIRQERLARADMGMLHIEALKLEISHGNGSNANPVYDFTGEDGVNRKLAHAFEAGIRDNDKMTKLLRAERAIAKGYDDAWKAIQKLRENPLLRDEPEPEPTQTESAPSEPPTKPPAPLPPVAGPAATLPRTPAEAPERASITQDPAERTIG